MAVHPAVDPGSRRSVFITRARNAARPFKFIEGTMPWPLLELLRQVVLAGEDAVLLGIEQAVGFQINSIEEIQIGIMKP